MYERFAVTRVLAPVALQAVGAANMMGMDRRTPTAPSDGLTRAADAAASAQGLHVEATVRREGETAERRYVGALSY